VRPADGQPSLETDLFGVADADATAPPVARRRADRSAEPGLSPDTALSIATLNLATRDILEGAIEPLWVRGDVVGFKPHRNGHWYFTLKDADAQIRCVTWASDARRHPAPPDEGMTVTALGKLTVFPARGELQLRVITMRAEGDGLWRKAFQQVHRKLDAEGLFSPQRKRPLPLLPRCVAVVTSADGAALHDVAAVVRRRCRITRVVVSHAVVQGEEAPASLVAALHRVARWGQADVVILGRGGGSREDLWAFNDERVVRAAAGMPIPVIAAIGHEVDVTLCDLAADHRAATPSAAAELAVPHLGDLVRHVRRLGMELRDAGLAHVEDARERLAAAGVAVTRAAAVPIERRRLELKGLAGQLQALSPLATLARGYAVVTDERDRVITAAASVTPGDPVVARFSDGRVQARAERVILEPGPPEGSP
jgi:exodeoxyribonuclease VII large subunit